MRQNIRSEVGILLKEISILLGETKSEKKWQQLFEHLHISAEQGDDDLRYSLLQIYGGMGLFNDLVLMSTQCKPDFERNEKLAQLRSQLYDLIKFKRDDNYR